MDSLTLIQKLIEDDMNGIEEIHFKKSDSSIEKFIIIFIYEERECNEYIWQNDNIREKFYELLCEGV